MSDLPTIVAQRHVIVCCGTGGVGKTTTAAALAVAAARAGRAVAVVTIDPAKRLGSALGVEGLTDTAVEIPRHRWDPDGSHPDRSLAASGRLSALMLDTKSTFDRLVQRTAPSTEHAERILANAFYRNISGVLSGTQEYMAMEKLHELHDSGAYDLIVVDTPPARHALDFLDAPNRLTRLLDHRVFRTLMAPARTTLRITGLAAQAFLRTVARVVGHEVVDDVVAFFRAFEGMEEGFRDRAVAVRALLADPSTSFVLVTSPRRDAVEESEHFARRLLDSDLTVDAVVVNRVHERTTNASVATLRARADAARVARGEPLAILAGAFDHLVEVVELHDREDAHVRALHERVPGAVLAHVPELDADVHDLETLRMVAEHLVGGPTPRGTARVAD